MADETAVLTIDAEDPERLLAAVQPDVGAIPGDATVEAVCLEGTLELRIRATSLSSLRAGVKTWTSLLAVARASDGASH